MKNRINYFVIAAALAALVLLAGCSGGGVETRSLFEGNHHAEIMRNQVAYGTMSMNIDKFGEITGTTTESVTPPPPTDLPAGIKVTGHVSDDGQIGITIGSVFYQGKVAYEASRGAGVNVVNGKIYSAVDSSSDYVLQWWDDMASQPK